MTDKEWLESKGWRLFATQRVCSNVMHCWDHPDHQPKYRGYFTQSDAKSHQRRVDDGYRCNCIPRDGGGR